jgi:hypothetical protein
MLDFKAMKPLFSFLHVPINPKNHWSNFVGWTMVECLHKQVFKKMKEVNIAVIFAIFKITMSFNVFVAMDAPFHMKLFEIWLWRTLEAFHISRH